MLKTRLKRKLVYKKYIKRGGKTFGPYFYKSRKENGKVITEYLGSAKENKSFFPVKNVLKPITLILILVFIFLLLFFLNSALTGKVSLQIDSSYQPGEQITGNLKMSLKQGELIPADAKIIVDNSGSISEYLLSDLISEQLNTGSFYAEGKTISGEGEGYGVLGEKKIYPTLNFELKIKKDKQEENAESLNDSEDSVVVSSDSQNESVDNVKIIEPEEENIEEPIEEIPTETQTPEQTTEPALAPNGVPSDEGKESTSITGESVSENKIEGSCSKDNPFIYNILEGETAEIQKNSVEINGESQRDDTSGGVNSGEPKIDESNLNLQIQDNTVTVTTEYYEIEYGYGEEYLTNEKVDVNIDLTQLGLIASDGQFVVKLVYGDIELANSNEQINVEEPIEINETIIEKNATEIIELNITREINETEILNVIENITTLQYRAVIGRPVKWIKTVKTDASRDLSIELPKKSVNISIKTGEEVQQALTELQDYENIVSDTDRNNFITGQITGVVSLDIEKNQGFLTRFFKWLSSFSLTGNVISENEIQDDIIETTDSKIVNVGEVLTKANITQETDVGVEYYTGAPISVEENIGNGKRIIISSDDEMNYIEILAYTLIEKNISMADVSKIKIYHYVTQEEFNSMNKQIEPVEENEVNETEVVNETKVEENVNQEVINNKSELTGETNNSGVQQVVNKTESKITNETTEPTGDTLYHKGYENGTSTKLIRVEVPFNAYDLNEDGYVDYIEWIVPHLSEQVYELIYIEKAIHLDENKTFISDIYDSVKEKDNNWSETINNLEYVRVTFEQELDSTKDITIYARSVNNETSQIEVYTGCDSYVMINGIKVPYDVYLKKKRIEEIRRLLENE